MWAIMKARSRGQNEDRQTPDHRARPASVELLREERRRPGKEIEWLEHKRGTATARPL